MWGFLEGKARELGGRDDNEFRASDTITITMFKNGSATALTTQLTVNTLNATFTSSDTVAGHAFSVGAGDQIAIQIVQTTSTPIVRLSVSTYCQ